ncbi:MAG TPA: Xaa-Pro peptidase family protein [Chloroflexota bacterium]|jgi:Xaa-Pro aminopeptidase
MNIQLLNRPRAKRIMEQEGVDGLLGTTFEHVLYLTNVWVESFFWGARMTQAFAVAHRERLDRPILAAGIGEVANFANSAAPGAELITYGEFYRFVEEGAQLDDVAAAVKDRVIDHPELKKANAVEALASALEAAGLTTGTLAYDERGLFLETYQALMQRLPDLKLVPGYQLFRRIRAVKTEEEQRRLEDALRVDEGAISAAMKVARPGIREQDMIAELEAYVVRHGAKPLFSQICFGGRGGMGNVMQRDGVLHENEVIRFDVGIMASNGYHSDIARNFSLGQPDDRAIRYWDATLAGIDAAAAAMKPGATAADIFHAAVSAVREAGIPHFNRNHVGHGIGLEVYDMPLLAPGDTTPIEEGMVFQVETPYYELGWAGIQPEDTIVATANGGKNLAQLSRRFEWS